MNPAAELARANARDALARTSQAVQAVKAMQAKARDIAIKGPNNLGMNPNAPGQRLPDVRDGLGVGGLKVATGVPAKLSSPQPGEDASLWKGAALPTQTLSGERTKVVIKQNEQQTVLNWETFNIGKKTTLQFDQSAGKADQGKWTAFNKINDPSGAPSQILGAIEAPGHVYVINRNGILFSGSSQVNTRSLIASSLPINDNLIKQGLLNNPNAEFLFATPRITDPAFTLGANKTYTLAETLLAGTTPTITTTIGGSPLNLRAGADFTVGKDGAGKPTVAFTDAGAAKIGTGLVTITYFNKQGGDVVVQAGARLNATASGDGNGGRIMLVAPNVRNDGALSAPAGQAIIAAGLQLGVAAHVGGDPSLRGLDVWVGAAGAASGTATNNGLIEVPQGSASISGRHVFQLAVIDSTTSVTLNGRIDLFASYGAVGNPNFDNSSGAGARGPQFLFQHTGVVTLGDKSVTRILPDYESAAVVPGKALPEKSQINVEGQVIHFAGRATVLAPNAEVNIRAGIWPYKDVDGNFLTLDSAGAADPGLSSYFSGSTQRFFYSGGQIYFDGGSLLNVAGSTEVFVPLAHSILEVEFRGAELADSPLQREGPLRAVGLTLDIRNTGVSNGRYWMGTPLGDASGLAGLIQRNAAQLTAEGGSVSLQAGGSIVVREGASIDVSGGYFRHEAGMVETSRLLQDGRIVDIKNAQPGQRYDGVYSGTFTTSHGKWGVTESFQSPFANGSRWEEGYVQGANGGTLNLHAPSMALDGVLRGNTVQDPRAQSFTTEHSSLSLKFAAEKTIAVSENQISFVPFSPTPPEVIFAGGMSQRSVEPFTLAGDAAAPLRADRLATVALSPELLGERGFGHLLLENDDGDVTVAAGGQLTAAPLGSITLSGANVTLHDGLSAPGGRLSFTAYNYSPAFGADFQLTKAGLVHPPAVKGRGVFSLDSGVTLDVGGLLVDDRPGNAFAFTQPLVLDGGMISVAAFSADLKKGSVIDSSGGAAASARGTVTYGKGGSISILAGKNPGFGPVLGGKLTLDSTLAGYSGRAGGSLAVQASLIQIGGTAKFPNTLVLTPEFFRSGGFMNYALIGIGGPSSEKVSVGRPETYAPAIQIAPGIHVAPVAERLLVIPHETSERELVIERTLAPVGLRTPVSLNFSAVGADDAATTNVLEARGDIVMGSGAQIVTDPGASVSFKGDTVTIRGSVTVPGGSISISGGSKFRLPADVEINETFARPTVLIGSGAELSVAGVSVLVPDAFGRRLGSLLPGGNIAVTGNIVAQAGALLDVSGASAIFDLDPPATGQVGQPIVPASSGLTSPLFSLHTVPTRLDSDGGSIDLQGSEMLFSDATLRGFAGGPSAVGGTLSIFSGRYYLPGAFRTGADINLTVTQSGSTLGNTNKQAAVGFGVRNAKGEIEKGAGFFAANRFLQGGFDSLDLGFKYLSAASPIPYGGNVEFRGPVTIDVPGKLRLAAGGVVRADAAVHLSSAYFASGQPFRAPLHPGDTVNYFTQDPPPSGETAEYFFAPTFGPGRLTVEADLIDLGTLSLQNIGRASFSAPGGDIRGNGTVQLAGDLTLRAAQVYPTTLSTFNVFAYDHDGIPGSVTITGSGQSAAPLSAGGSLNIFASNITQGGVLRAPFGSITLGWDGTDIDPSDAALDAPDNPVARGKGTVPTAKQVTLKSGSLTSVSGVDGAGTELLIPFGLSPDGASWIDPRGVNVTTSGLPEKRVSIAGASVTTERGSTVDLRGGGELFAFRWVPGPGGSADLLGNASAAWSESVDYSAGDLVTSGGKTWTARVRHSGQKPTASIYWAQVAESYAIIPGFDSKFAPYAPFNTGANAGDLGGDPGYVSGGLHIGDRISLENVPGLGSGTYTLLPRRYALMPGAFLVTPDSGDPIGTFTLPGGANYVSGFTSNAFSQPGELSTVRTRFEVASGEIVRKRSEVAEYRGNTFFADAAKRLDVQEPQRLPIDAGSLAFHGNTALRLEGGVRATTPLGGRGASIDVSSFADMYLVGGTGKAPDGAKVVLHTGILNSWGAESLLIGGLRRETANGTTIDVRTSRLVLDNPGASFGGPDITLASKAALTLTDGSSLQARGKLTEQADKFLISGDGTLLRASVGGAAIERTGVDPAATAPRLTLGAKVRIGGASVVLDSTYATSIDPTATLDARSLALGGGQISILLEPITGVLEGAVVSPQFIIDGKFLEAVQQVSALTLRSYRSIDFYGSGEFGSPALHRLELLASGIRGFGQGADDVVLKAGDVLFSNPANVAALAAPAAAPSGSFQVDATTLRLGANAFGIAGYGDVAIEATGGVLGQGTGSFTTPGNLTITAPLITGAGGATQAISAGGALTLAKSDGKGQIVGGLGTRLTFTGASVLADASVQAPSGRITLRATTGDVTVGGELNAAGAAREFYDLVRYTDAGTITLVADVGKVDLAAGAKVSVAAPEKGGNAGSVTIRAARGSFRIDPAATLRGNAASDKTAGSFSLDTKALTSFDALGTALNTGGFFEQRNFRVRTGDIVITNPGGNDNVARNFIASADAGNIAVIGAIDASGVTGGTIRLTASGSLTIGAFNRSVQLAGAVNESVIALASTNGLTVGQSVRGTGVAAGTLIAAIDGTKITLSHPITAAIPASSQLTFDVSGAKLTVRGEKFSSAGKGGEIRLEAGAAINGVANVSASLDLASGATLDLGVDAFKAGEGTKDYTDPTSSAFLGQFTGRLHLRAPRNGSDLKLDATGAGIEGASSIVVEGFRVYDRSAIAANSQLTPAFLATLNTDATTFINNAGAAILGHLPAALRDVVVVSPGAEIYSSGNLQLGQTTDNAANDWNLAALRYGPNGAPGVLTLRAAGNLVFNNALSDGFTPLTTAPVGQQLWLGSLMDLNPALPLNTQAWSFRLAAGSDLSAADFSRVRPLDALAAGSGSLFLGKFYTSFSGVTGATGLTANAVNNRFQVIRTGAGDIEIAAGRDVQLRNQFATIYTAGVRLPAPTTVFAAGDFVLPIVNPDADPSQQDTLGKVQQIYPVQYSMAGGNVGIFAGSDIGRFTQSGGVTVVDSSAQLPMNWLYRRGYVDPVTGLVGVGGVNEESNSVVDPAASTTWWIDHSNFFEGVGALGGGNVALRAGHDIINVDAVAPTNARMAGQTGGANIAPDAAKLLELGGGDITVRAGNNIDGGVYYVERGEGSLVAGGSITTNRARSPSLGLLTSAQEFYDPLTWLPTTLFAGRAHFDLSALGDVLLGPVVNPFLLPVGLNNKFWYKSYWNTYGADSGVDVASFGGDVNLRLAVTRPPNREDAEPILIAWMQKKNLFLPNNAASAANFQPWIRLAETAVAPAFNTAVSLMPPTFKATAFDGDVNIAGKMNLFPAPRGTLELAASGGIVGLQPIGKTRSGFPAQTGLGTAWAATSINVSDADPASLPGVVNPFAYQGVVGLSADALIKSEGSFLSTVDLALNETGSYTGRAASFATKQALHARTPLHSGDPEPVRLFAAGGDITGITFFSAKMTQVLAANDITDVSFYVQNVGAADISLFSAGRDIVPNNENGTLRAFASDLTQGNRVVDPLRGTLVGNNTQILPGDLQITGPGVLEVFAGRNLDLGNGANFSDGTGLGLTSIGNFRNPFLPFAGADIIALAGVGGAKGGAALGLSGSALDFSSFAEGSAGAPRDSAYLAKLDVTSAAALTDEQKAIVALEDFYRTLRDTGRDFTTTGTYDTGETLIAALFGTAKGGGEIFTRARDIRTSTGGSLSLAAPGGGVTMASDIFGNPLTPPGVVSEFGGAISIFTDQSVDIGQARIFTLRGGDITIWSSNGDIAAGNAPRTVVTAPPTRVVIDVTSADVQTDLGGLATGGGIGVLASVKDVPPGDVDLIAPKGIVDAGDAGIRVTGNINIAATAVLNAANIAVGGSSAGVPSAPTVAAPNLGGLSAASNAAGAGSSSAREMAQQQQRPPEQKEEPPSIISVDVLGYGDGSAPEASPAPGTPQPPAAPDDEEEKRRKQKAIAPQAA